ncbi:hypothetical protein VKT23_005954 [Stygiomarasmius scandens]|uniref:N-acetyltransferase domain-containing protein n=1 Tax=Marasmiellus scandens TaxID=2682957 RepID=A0ABR1JS61_9AGAR
MAYTLRQLSSSAATDAEIDAVVKCLDAAFAEDHFTLVCIGGKPTSNGQVEADLDLMYDWNKAPVIAALLAGEVHVAETFDHGISGAAVWFGPGQDLFGSEDQRDTALVPLLDKLSLELSQWLETDFLPRYKNFTDNAFGSNTKTNSWHLQCIGTIPEERGKGIATALIDVIRAKKGDVKMVLETETAENLKFYNKNGFEVKGEASFRGLHEGANFNMWALVSRE